MWIIVNGIFESQTLSTYLIRPFTDVLDVNCYLNQRLSFGRKSCLSIHTNFSGDWIESEEVCKKQGAHLWSARSAIDWNGVMQTPVYTWYFDRKMLEPVVYDGRINAVSLLRSFSVFYLGMSSFQNEVLLLFYFLLL